MRTVVALSLALAASLSAQSVTTLPASKDNTLYESATGALSNGLGQGAFCGLSGQPTIRRMVIAFDVSSIPAGARVVSAELHLNISRSNVFMPVNVFAHRVLADWGEGTSNAGANEGAGAPATPGDATWLHRVYPNQLWTTPGGDFAATVSAVGVTPQLGAVTIGPAAGLVDDVQAWVDGRAGNSGWLLQTDEQLPTVVRRFDTRENPIVANQPSLVVTWVAAGQAASLGTGCVGSNSQSLLLTAQGQPLQGTTVGLSVQNGLAGGLALHAFALGVLATPMPLYSGCDLWLDPTFGLATGNVLVLSPNGAGAQNLPVPQTPVLFGVAIGAQTFALDAGIAAGFVASNGVLLVIG